MSVSKTVKYLFYQQPIVIGFNSIMGWYTDKPGKDMQPSNSSDNSTPVASPPSRRAVQIKEHTNSDFTSQPLLTISADDVTMRTVGRQSSMDKQIISEAVCERVKHYLFLERVKPEVSSIKHKKCLTLLPAETKQIIPV